jgi:hypothetical protein
VATVIVEGVSDRVAVEALARRRGRDLAAEGVAIVVLGGAHAVARYLAGLGPESRDGRLLALCDAAEEAHFAGLEVFVCRPDLEAELIRAVGPEAVVRVIEALGERRSFHSFQRQPAQRERPLEAQLHRFLGTHSGRKALYARALVEAVAEGRLPAPLDNLLLAI